MKKVHFISTIILVFLVGTLHSVSKRAAETFMEI